MRRRSKPRVSPRKRSRSRKTSGPTGHLPRQPGQVFVQRKETSAQRRSEAAKPPRASAIESRRYPIDAAGVALLLGATIAIALVGLIRTFNVRAEVPIPTRFVVGAALMALAIGVRVPHGFATWFCATTWRRLLSRDRHTAMSLAQASHWGQDRPLHWVVLSLLVLLASVATVCTPWAIRLAKWMYQGMLNEFVWSNASHTLLLTGVSFAAALPAFALLGLAGASMHHLMCSHGKWDTKASAYLLLGAVAGYVAATEVLRFGAKTDSYFLSASLPALLAALLAAAVCASGSRSFHTSGSEAAPSAPEWSDRWPRILRTGIVLVVLIATGSVVAWLQRLMDSDTGSTISLSVLLGSLGVGILIGSRRKRDGLRSIGGFGVACVFAGIAAAMSVCPGITLQRSAWLALALAVVGAVAVGAAAGYGNQVLLHRVGGRSSVGARTLARSLASAAVMVWLVAPAMVAMLGPVTALTANSLALFAIGGLLIIHEPTYSRRTRRLRLSAIFVAIGFLIVHAGSTPAGTSVDASAVEWTGTAIGSQRGASHPWEHRAAAFVGR